MSNADIIQFEAQISPFSGFTANIDSSISQDAFISAELRLEAFVDEIRAMTAYINQAITEEVEL